MKILTVFTRRIGLLFFSFIFFYFDGTGFSAMYENAQIGPNILMLVAFLVLYKRSVKRTRRLMIYAVIIGFIGEYLFSIVLGMYTYRLSNLPFYIPLGHAVVYDRTYCF
jgi:cell shape-determining protein MreD